MLGLSLLLVFAPFCRPESGNEIETKRINIMSVNEKQSPGVDKRKRRRPRRVGHHVMFPRGIALRVPTTCSFFFWHTTLLSSLKKKTSNLKCQPLQEQRPELGSKTQPHFSALFFSSENPFSLTPSLSMHLPSSHPLQLPSHLPTFNNHSRGDGPLHQPRQRKGPRRRFGPRGSCPSLLRPIS